MTTARVRIDKGSIIGPYVVERRLAQGGMSILFLARETTTGREAVLKIVPDELSTASARARLMREARALASVDHPGIVRIYGTGDLDGTPWIAMEYVQGIDLKRVVAERGAVSPDRALGWLVQAADALVAAHDAGVIHRDLKPSNLLLTPEDQIKVVDFGIAKRRAEAGGDVLTSQREVLGTPAYLSPEQLEHGLADERSDVWALGCVLYELVVGEPPFGRGGSALTMAAILRDEPVFPASLMGDRALVLVIQACLRKNSFARVGSPRELALLARDARENPQSELAAPPPERSSTRAPARPTSVSPPPMRVSDRPPRASQRAGSTSKVPVLGSTPPPATRASSGSLRIPSAAPSGRAGRVKGTAIRAGLTWYASTYGADTLTRVYDMASHELRGTLRLDDPAFGIIASGWYDVESIGELLVAMERLVDPEDPDAYVNALTTAIAKDNVGGIYRSLFKLISVPAMLEAHAQRVWGTYVDEGVFSARIPKRGELEIEIRGWTHHHPAVCRTVGFMIQNVLRTIGYAGLVVERTSCVSEGDGLCAFEGPYLA
jgi:serine/threonine protein kinase